MKLRRYYLIENASPVFTKDYVLRGKISIPQNTMNTLYNEILTKISRIEFWQIENYSGLASNEFGDSTKLTLNTAAVNTKFRLSSSRYGSDSGLNIFLLFKTATAYESLKEALKHQGVTGSRLTSDTKSLFRDMFYGTGFHGQNEQFPGILRAAKDHVRSLVQSNLEWKKQQRIKTLEQQIELHHKQFKKHHEGLLHHQNGKKTVAEQIRTAQEELSKLKEQ